MSQKPPQSRKIATELLGQTLDPNGLGLQEAFDAAMAKNKLDERDRGFIRQLVTSCLRHLGEIDAALNRHWQKPPSDLFVTNAIRLGAAQKLFLGTPVHAAVYETVALIKPRNPRLAGLANAVLRKVEAAPDLPPSINSPLWLFKVWSKHFGRKRAEKIAKAHRIQPMIDLSVRPTDQAELAEHYGGVALGAQSVRLNGPTRIEELDGFAQGRFWVQDLAATLPAMILDPRPGARVLDLCAAPGGKTAQLCAAGADVVGIEKDPVRAQRLKANMARLEMTPEIIVADALEFEPKALFDSVLLDAPCSATGTIRRHPDIPWRRQQRSLLSQTALQRKLLIKAASFLRPGGRLVYAVCSLQADEGLRVVEDALATRSAGLYPREIDPTSIQPLGHLFANPPGYWVQTLPSMLADQGGMDGFFIANLEKQS